MNIVAGETSFYGDSVLSVYGVMKDGDGFSREVFALGFLFFLCVQRDQG